VEGSAAQLARPRASQESAQTGTPVDLEAAYRVVRGTSERLAAPLQPEDMVVQSMPDASPTKWHLAHTSWFFETFVLAAAGIAPDHHPAFAYLFNSYYNAVGPRSPRPSRGLMTRPTVAEVRAYRAAVDEAMLAWLRDGGAAGPLGAVAELGLHHEQQHQELLLTDIKHAFAQNPLLPPYIGEPGAQATAKGPSAASTTWIALPGGLHEVGAEPSAGFAFDNEGPRHRVWLEPYRLATGLVTCGDWLEFMAAGGYAEPGVWLSDGWAQVQANGWQAPLYWWREDDGEWRHYTLYGPRRVHPAEPVCHVSFYEADAFARWSGARLPTELEWEVAARAQPLTGTFQEAGVFHPRPAATGEGLAQVYGEVWQWTASPYVGYPGYRPAAGAIGEYNGKFMCNQLVLRGGSIATPRSHIRPTYRNFFYPHCRWQFAGLRLAGDADG
jgi:ergothioneine biosynthesis protein EgtB